MEEYMATRDLAHRMKCLHSINPGAKTASVNGATVDTTSGSSYEAAAFYIDYGAWTDGSHTFTFQDSVDGVTWNTLTSIAAGGVLDAASPVVTTNASQNSMFLTGYHGYNRYLRVITTVTGTTTGAVYGAGVILGVPHHHPAA